MIKALIIEDDPSFVSLFKRKLARLGIFSMFCTSSTEAIEIIRIHNPDIIFLDLYLQDKDGLDFLKIKAMTPGLKKIPVVVISSIANFGVMSECFFNGAASYLIKPINVDLFLSELKRLGFHIA